MTGSFYQWAKKRDLPFCKKKHLDYCPETTSFPGTESTRDGCAA